MGAPLISKAEGRTCRALAPPRAWMDHARQPRPLLGSSDALAVHLTLIRDGTGLAVEYDAPSHRDGVPRDPDGRLVVNRVRMLGRERARLDADLVTTARDLVAATGAKLLAHKGFDGVEDLSARQRRQWRAEAKAAAVAELRVALGMGITDARRTVGLACSPEPVRELAVSAMTRGEVTLPMAQRFWTRCSEMDVDDATRVAGALFGTDPAVVAVERLTPDGALSTDPWHAADYHAALEREAVRVEGQDEVAARERRRAAHAQRNTTLQVNDDSTSTLTITGPLTTGVAIHNRVDKMARALRKAGDPRTLTQLRCDVAQTLLLYGEPQLPEPGDITLTPADLAQIARVTSATPPIALQVVVPFGALAASSTRQPQGACERRPDDADPDPPPAPAVGDGTPDRREPDPPPAPAPAVGDGTPDRREPDPPPAPAPAVGDGTPDRREPDPPPAPAPAVGQDQPGRRGEDDGPTLLPPAPVSPAVADSPSPTGTVAELLGSHPAFLTPEHARELALTPGTVMHRLLVDPADGRLIERTTSAYRPDADMRRQILAADVYSRAPGSRQPGHTCELDHEVPYGSGGPTAETNLNLKDKHHHNLKTLEVWRSAMRVNRDVTWESLLGQTTTTRSHDYRQYLVAATPLDQTNETLPQALRPDVDDRRDLACQVLYAVLAHRSPTERLAADDDRTDPNDPHSGDLHGWMYVTHTVGRATKRRGPKPGTRTAEQLLGIPGDLGIPGADPDTGRPLEPRQASGAPSPADREQSRQPLGVPSPVTVSAQPATGGQPWAVGRSDPPPF